MSFAQRFTLVLLAAFFVSSVATSAAAYVAAPSVVHAMARFGSAARASLLAVFRLLPSISAIAITALVLGPGYFRHEQRGEPEGTGLALIAGAIGGLWLIGASVARVVHGIVRTSQLRRRWEAEGRPLDALDAGMPAVAIESQYPLVAVLGAVRPRLFISRAVLDSCSGAELAAIVQHERRHVSAFDNATRVAMDAAPDLFGFSARASAVAVAWHHAVEHRADDAARHRLDLASALVRVARMAGDVRPTPLPASALYRGDGIEERVKRLIGERADASAAPADLARIGTCAAAFVAIVSATALSPAASAVAHAIMEALVSLP